MIYDCIGKMEVQPEVVKVKSHQTAQDMIIFSRNNRDIDKWVILNEAAHCHVAAATERVLDQPLRACDL